MYRIEHPTENSLLVRFSDEIEISTTIRIANIAQNIRSEMIDLLEVVPSYSNLYLEYDFLKTNLPLLESKLKIILESPHTIQTSTKTITLPCFYDPSVGLDLINLAEEKRLSIKDIIQIHSSQEYTVFSTGFAPGFAYLAEVDPRITSPRHDTPRARVPAGSVGIADRQTAVYPSTSPAGWKIIGNCPLTLFDLDARPMSPFLIGDKVKFQSISSSEFLQLGGEIE